MDKLKDKKIRNLLAAITSALFFYSLISAFFAGKIELPQELFMRIAFVLTWGWGFHEILTFTLVGVIIFLPMLISGYLAYFLSIKYSKSTLITLINLSFFGLILFWINTY